MFEEIYNVMHDLQMYAHAVIRNEAWPHLKKLLDSLKMKYEVYEMPIDHEHMCIVLEVE